MINIQIDFDNDNIILKLPGAEFTIEEWNPNSIRIKNSGLKLSGFNEEVKYHENNIGTFEGLVIQDTRAQKP